MIHEEYVYLSDDNIRKSIEVTDSFFDSDEYHNYHSSRVDSVLKFNFIVNEQLAAVVYFGLSNVFFATSPYSSPFSSVKIFIELSESDTHYFIEQIVKKLKSNGTKDIRILLFPNHYDPKLNLLLSKVLTILGFTVDFVDVNSYIDLLDFKNLENYIANIGSSYRKKYNKALRHNLSFKEIDSPEYFSAYNVIKMNRESKGYPLNLSYTHLLELIEHGILDFRIFGVFDDSDLIASAFIIEFNSIAYVLYWGDLIEKRDMSPMSLLIPGIVSYYLSKDYKEIDLGTSSKNGIINEGLLRFKDSILASRSFKYCFYLQLEKI